MYIFCVACLLCVYLLSCLGASHLWTTLGLVGFVWICNGWFGKKGLRENPWLICKKLVKHAFEYPYFLNTPLQTGAPLAVSVLQLTKHQGKYIITPSCIIELSYLSFSQKSHTKRTLTQSICLLKLYSNETTILYYQRKQKVHNYQNFIIVSILYL